LNAWLVEVQAGEKTYYLDPATRFCPFGLLSWEQTGVRGIRVTAGGSTFVQIPQPRSSDAVVERRGVLDLDAEGALRGKLEVAFRGQEALHRRLNAREMDEAARLKAMESEVTGWFQAGTSVKLDRITGWDGSDEPLKVDITVAIPEFASTTGRRLLLPATLFRARKDMLLHPKRVHPVYFPYPYQEVDSLQVRLPETLQIESLPPAQKGELVYANYQISVRAEEPRSLTLERRLRLDGYFFKIDQYPSIRSFYEAVRKGDEQQLVLQIRR